MTLTALPGAQPSPCPFQQSWGCHPAVLGLGWLALCTPRDREQRPWSTTAPQPAQCGKLCLELPWEPVPARLSSARPHSSALLSQLCWVVNAGQN